MPVEIRELVIQAKVLENADAPVSQFTPPPSKTPAMDADEEESAERVLQDPEWIDQIVQKCMARMQEWLNEKSMR